VNVPRLHGPPPPDGVSDGNLSNVACALDAKNKAGYYVYSVLRPPHQPSPMRSRASASHCTTSRPPRCYRVSRPTRWPAGVHVHIEWLLYPLHSYAHLRTATQSYALPHAADPCPASTPSPPLPCPAHLVRHAASRRAAWRRWRGRLIVRQPATVHDGQAFQIQTGQGLLQLQGR
jgi:hypothetical protein